MTERENKPDWPMAIVGLIALIVALIGVFRWDRLFGYAALAICAVFYIGRFVWRSISKLIPDPHDPD
jgi:hypothetical protein